MAWLLGLGGHYLFDACLYSTPTKQHEVDEDWTTVARSVSKLFMLTTLFSEQFTSRVVHKILNPGAREHPVDRKRDPQQRN